ncbi:MAG: hypothetical protein ACI9N1_000920 [Flavobacteriales bacterium]|jgi:hypothetical protein
MSSSNNQNSTVKNIDEIEINIENRLFFRSEYYVPRVPVLIKGGAKGWNLMTKWNKEYLSERCGHYPCTVVSDSRPAFSKERSTLKKYFANHKGKSTLTLQAFEKKNTPLYFQDIPIPNPLFSRSDIYRFFFYHSHKDEGTLPHYHGDAFNILQSGTKHWIFYDAKTETNPEGRKHMMEMMKKYPPGSQARDFFEKELKSTLLDIPNTQQCIQQAGDIVYVPREYCHSVLNQSEVMGIVFETKILTR